MSILLIYTIDKLAYYMIDYLNERVVSGQKIGKLNKFFQVKDTLDVVVFGNSRANRHIDVSLLGESAFNMGLDGKGLAFHSTLIECLPKRTKQLVILHLDKKELFDMNYDGGDLLELRSRFHKDSLIEKRIIEKDIIGYFEKFLWVLDYNHKIFPILKNFFTPNFEYDGFDPINVSDAESEILKKNLALDRPVLCDTLFNLNPLSVKYLNDIKKSCLRNGKELVVVTSPILDAVACPLDDLIMTSYLESQGFNYLNLRALFKDELRIGFWKDLSHLSAEGADYFTLYLREKLEEQQLMQ